MQMRRCMKCMEELLEGDRFCPVCGYDQDSGSQPSNALKQNTVLHSRYLIGNVIGRGGFGITYVGWDMTLEMKVAVKEYFPTGTAARSNSYSNEIQWDFTDEGKIGWSDGIQRFLKEARKMAKLDSVSSIVRVRDAFDENQTAYIVMDFVEGVTLKNYLLSHGVLRYGECMRLLSPILDSLAMIHDRGFIHRDISPDNIMLQPDGTARLLDMGAAVDVRANKGHASMAVIKRNFSAPEQYMETEILGSWTDVYAMAATMYYCMTGKVVPEAMERELKKTPLCFDPNLYIPVHVIGALCDGLKMQADGRIQDMQELKRRLTAQEADASEDTAGDEAIKETPVQDQIPKTERVDQAEESGRYSIKEDTGRSKRLKQGMKIALVAVGLMSTMCVLTMMFFLFRDSVSSASSDGKESAKMESAGWKTQATTESRATEATEPSLEIDYDFCYETDEIKSGIILTEYLGEESSIKLPSEMVGLPVTELGEYLFNGNSTLEKVILPEHLEYISYWTFKDCVNLKQVEIPDSLRVIYDGAFEGCTSLQYLELPEGLWKISLSAFQNTGLKSLTIPSTVEVLEGSSGILSIENLTFAEGNSTYKMVDGVIYNINGGLTDFPESRGGEFTVPAEVNVIESFAFNNTSLTTLMIPGNVKVIEMYGATGSHSLETVVMEDGVEALGDSCFSGCDNLREVVIPQSVMMIGGYAFSRCDSLKSVTISRDCQVTESTFDPSVEIQYYD